jgi:hypothetical protein
MHRLRLPYALGFGRSTCLGSSTQGTANLGVDRSVSLDDVTVRRPALSGSQSDLFLSSDNDSGRGIALLGVRVNRKLFSKAKSEFMSDGSFIGSVPSNAPARPSPIP